MEIRSDRVCFSVNGVLMATHFKSMPGPGDLLTSTVRIVNGTAPASTTTVTIDYDSCQNHNIIKTGLLSDSEQIVATAAPLQTYNYSVAGVIVINTDLLVIDCSQIRGLNIQCTSMGTTGVVTPAWSNDGTNWVTATLISEAGATSTTFNAAALRSTNVRARYFRLRLTTATTAGTTTIIVTGAQTDASPIVTTQPVSGTVTANIGTGALAAGTNAVGDVGLQYRANATGAATTLKFASSTTVNNALVLTGARRLIGWTLTNTTASFKYFRFYNKATAPTSGESPTFMVGIPPNSTVVSPPIVGGIAMSLGLGIACTGAVADTDATVTAANDVVGAIYYA